MANDERKKRLIVLPPEDAYDGSFRTVMKRALGSLFGVLIVLAVASFLFGR